MVKLDKNKWNQTYICNNCEFSFEKVSMSQWQKCPKCKEEATSTSKITFNGLHEGLGSSLTPSQKRKLKWSRHEKFWREDIKSRRILPSGDIAIVKDGKIKEVRKKGET